MKTILLLLVSLSLILNPTVSMSNGATPVSPNPSAGEYNNWDNFKRVRQCARLDSNAAKLVSPDKPLVFDGPSSRRDDGIYVCGDGVWVHRSKLWTGLRAEDKAKFWLYSGGREAVQKCSRFCKSETSNTLVCVDGKEIARACPAAYH